MDAERAQKLKFASDASAYERMDSVTRVLQLLSRFRERQASDKATMPPIIRKSADIVNLNGRHAIHAAQRSASDTRSWKKKAATTAAEPAAHDDLNARVEMSISEYGQESAAIV